MGISKPASRAVWKEKDDRELEKDCNTVFLETGTVEGGWMGCLRKILPKSNGPILRVDSPMGLGSQAEN